MILNNINAKVYRKKEGFMASDNPKIEWSEKSERTSFSYGIAWR